MLVVPQHFFTCLSILFVALGKDSGISKLLAPFFALGQDGFIAVLSKSERLEWGRTLERAVSCGEIPPLPPQNNFIMRTLVYIRVFSTFVPAIMEIII